MDFFTPEEKAARQKLIDEKKREHEANLEHFKKAVGPLIQEIITEVKEAYAQNKWSGFVDFSQKRLIELGAWPLPYPKALVGSFVKDTLESELKRITRQNFTVSEHGPHRDDPHRETTYTASLHFTNNR